MFKKIMLIGVLSMMFCSCSALVENHNSMLEEYKDVYSVSVPMTANKDKVEIWSNKTNSIIK